MSPPFPAGGFPPARPRSPSRDVDAPRAPCRAPSTAMIVASEVDPRADLPGEREFHLPRARARGSRAGRTSSCFGRRSGTPSGAHPVFSKKGKYFLSAPICIRTTLEKYLALPRSPPSSARGVGDPMAIGRVIREMIDEPGGLGPALGHVHPHHPGPGGRGAEEVLDAACCVENRHAPRRRNWGTASYIRGLETTATYDPSTEQFVIHGPTLTSTKWWPGGMGKTATHAIVMARLVTHRGEDKGPHAFVVQIRANEDHATMPGVTAGDIGPKMGYNAVDNGYLRFDHVRVPRRAMLMKHAAMAKDGTYTPPPVAKAAYGTMVFVRSDIVDERLAVHEESRRHRDAVDNLVRRQSNPGSAPNSRRDAQLPKHVELQVMDYQHSQRSRSRPGARVRPLHCTSDYMRRAHVLRVRKNRAPPRTSPRCMELHATSSGLKACCSWATKDAMQSCAGCAAAGRASWRSPGSAPSGTTRPARRRGGQQRAVPPRRATAQKCAARRGARRRTRGGPAAKADAAMDETVAAAAPAPPGTCSKTRRVPRMGRSGARAATL